MKNLVLGSEGFVGRSFCAYLEKNGQEVIHFDIKNTDAQDARKARLPLDGVDHVELSH